MKRGKEKKKTVEMMGKPKALAAEQENQVKKDEHDDGHEEIACVAGAGENRWGNRRLYL